jgi:DUF971 family protein
MMNLSFRPKSITIDRGAGLLNITWHDDHVSQYPLRLLRASCPCATCREERRQARQETDLLRLSSGPLPSIAITDATLVGNYALRLQWTDGHDAGIYAFNLLRASCPCPFCHPEGPPQLLFEE